MGDPGARPTPACLLLVPLLVASASSCGLPKVAPRSAASARAHAAEGPRGAIGPEESKRLPDEMPRPVPAETPSSPESARAWLNIRVNQDSSGYNQLETVIAANPENPLNLIAGAIDFRDGGEANNYAYTTFDGGQTWTEQRIDEPIYTAQCDPAVAFCSGGKAVFTGISYDLPNLVVYAHTTSDGGTTWSGPHYISTGGGNDKPWVACDTSSKRFRGRAYACWTAFLVPGYRIQVAYSRDSGVTWSTPRTVSTEEGVLCSVAVSADGAVNVAWKNESVHDFVFSRSVDGGRTFATPVTVVHVYPIPNGHVFRRPTLPALAVDTSGGRYSGRIYIVWNDQRFSNVSSIMLTSSSDGGATWSYPILVADAPFYTGEDRWFPWITVDPKGRVIVTFLDERRYPSSPDYEVWGAISRDGGETFDTNFLVSDASSNPYGSDFVGDYTGLAATADRLYPIWQDFRAGTGEMDVYTDRFPNLFDYDEVRNFRWLDERSLDFETQDDRFGQDLDYDVVSGYLSELREDGGFARAICLAPGWPTPPVDDDRVPPVEDGYYYLVRSHGPNGVGTYGYGTGGRPNVRDALNDGADPCP